MKYLRHRNHVLRIVTGFSLPQLAALAGNRGLGLQESNQLNAMHYEKCTSYTVLYLSWTICLLFSTCSLVQSFRVHCCCVLFTSCSNCTELYNDLKFLMWRESGPACRLFVVCLHVFNMFGLLCVSYVFSVYHMFLIGSVYHISLICSVSHMSLICSVYHLLLLCSISPVFLLCSVNHIPVHWLPNVLGSAMFQINLLCSVYHMLTVPCLPHSLNEFCLPHVQVEFLA